MISLTYLTDLYRIKELLLKDKIYKTLLNTNSLDQWIPEIVTTNWFEIKKDNKTIGIFVLKHFTKNCLEFHGGLYKEFRGKDTPIILLECLNKVPSNYQTSFMTKINKSNSLAIRLVEKLGFEFKTEIDGVLIYAEQ